MALTFKFLTHVMLFYSTYMDTSVRITPADAFVLCVATLSVYNHHIVTTHIRVFLRILYLKCMRLSMMRDNARYVNYAYSNLWFSLKRFTTLRVISYIKRDHFVNELIQWEMTLQFNVVSHWLSPYPEWSLINAYYRRESKPPKIIFSLQLQYIVSWIRYG